ncbi:hypothetical protein QL285_057427 [Trifolium repens]|nr:hypothetical protein QL285_057427 [Trifolium repens]
MASSLWLSGFNYVSCAAAGWEGTAHDARVFDQALTNVNFNFPHPPPGKYYLVDSGYPTPIGYIGPYRCERYRLPDFRRSNGFANHNEVFNYYHSSLRCTIERTFGSEGCWWCGGLLGSVPAGLSVLVCVATVNVVFFMGGMEILHGLMATVDVVFFMGGMEILHGLMATVDVIMVLMLVSSWVTVLVGLGWRSTRTSPLYWVEVGFGFGRRSWCIGDGSVACFAADPVFTFA